MSEVRCQEKKTSRTSGLLQTLAVSQLVSAVRTFGTYDATNRRTNNHMIIADVSLYDFMSAGPLYRVF